MTKNARAFFCAFIITIFFVSTAVRADNDSIDSQIDKLRIYPKWQKVVKKIEYSDKTGKNVFMLTETAWKNPRGGSTSKEIQGYLFNVNNKEVKLTWAVKEHVFGCAFEPTEDTFPDRASVTDLDKNGISEVWVPYLVRCLGKDSSPKMKIIMYEGDKKHALRGELQQNKNGKFSSGQYKMDSNMRNSAIPIRDYAEKMWFKNIESLNN